MIDRHLLRRLRLQLEKSLGNVRQSRQTRYQKQLLRNQRLFRIVGETALIGGWFMDMNVGLPNWSDEICAIHDLPAGHQPSVDEAIAFYAPGSRERLVKRFNDCCHDGISFDEELEVVTAKGRDIWVRVIGQAVRDEQGRIIQVQGSTQDITAQKQLSQQIMRLAKRLTKTLESITDGFFTLDTDWCFTYINQEAERMLKRGPTALLGTNVWRAFPDAVGSRFETEYRHAMAAQVSVHFEAHNADLDLWLEVHAYPSNDGLAVYFRNINDRRLAEQQQRILERSLAFNASHDALTRLPNRTLLEDRLTQSYRMAQRHQRLVAVLFVDLDDFKPINDTLGHEVGDHLLVEVARRLQRQLRPGDTVARFGGDEFVVVLSDLDSGEGALPIIECLLKSIAAPFYTEGNELFITASIGVALSDTQTIPPMALIQQADLAMYKAKRQGRNTYQWFTPDLDQQVGERVALRNDLQRAIEEGQFELYYQPQVHGPSGRIIGFEALLRWHHPSRGCVSPAVFIQLAEETGQIIPINDWVMATACRDNQHLNGLGLGRFTMAVNVSALQFHRPGFLAGVQRALIDSGMPDDLLELELTEGILLDNTEQAMATLQSLRQQGISLAIDDFGTGFSSLSYLKDLPIGKIKIDHSFIQDVVSDYRDAAIVEGVTAMASRLQLQVVAEGVETQAQLAYLSEHRCDIFQGYYFARPMPLDDLTLFLKDYHPAGESASTPLD